MLGPLPRLYRVLLVVVSVIVFLTAGAYVGHLTVVPVPIEVGAVLGAFAGLAVAWALLHDFHHATHPARVGRRR
jgi:hypothetical protein